MLELIKYFMFNSEYVWSGTLDSGFYIVYHDCIEVYDFLGNVIRVLTVGTWFDVSPNGRFVVTYNASLRVFNKHDLVNNSVNNILCESELDSLSVSNNGDIAHTYTINNEVFIAINNEDIYSIVLDDGDYVTKQLMFFHDILQVLMWNNNGYCISYFFQKNVHLQLNIKPHSESPVFFKNSEDVYIITIPHTTNIIFIDKNNNVDINLKFPTIFNASDMIASNNKIIVYIKSKLEHGDYYSYELDTVERKIKEVFKTKNWKTLEAATGGRLFDSFIVTSPESGPEYKNQCVISYYKF